MPRTFVATLTAATLGLSLLAPSVTRGAILPITGRVMGEGYE